MENVEQAFKKKVLVTTSWDDGNKQDLRLAELLAKYGLQGTFYIPVSVSPAGLILSYREIRELSCSFEIGAHGVNHYSLSKVDDTVAHREIFESKAFLEDITGQGVEMFCFPNGRFKSRHLMAAKQAGYLGCRTIRMLSTDLPHIRGGIFIMNTTVQVYPHGTATIIKHLAKRLALYDLVKYINMGRQVSGNWLVLAKAMFTYTLQNGGLFHIWGHSWEIEQQDQWGELQNLMEFLHKYRHDAHFCSNREAIKLCPL